MTGNERVRIYQQTMARHVAEHRRAVARLEQAMARRDQVVTVQDRAVAEAQRAVDEVVVAMADALGTQLAAGLVDLDPAVIRRLARRVERSAATGSTASDGKSR